MTYIDNLDEIRSHIKLADIPTLIGISLKKKGKAMVGQCPNCDKPEGLEIAYWSTAHKDGYKCFKCGISGTDGVEFLTSYGKMDFQEAVKKVAELYNITIEEKGKVKKTKTTKTTSKISFRDLQLAESGIPKSSVKISQGKGKAGTLQFEEFETGSLDTHGNLLNEDDMIINYVDLDSNLVTFKREKSPKEIQFRRVRHKNPELHKDKEGKSMKYGQPYGSGTQIFIPEEVRKAYHAEQQITTLYFEEGEKKAKKKTIHGMYSIGFTGIHGIARNGQLPYDIIKILEKCNVKRVVFCLDADWRDIIIKPGKSIDERPKSFRTAIINFRDYFRALATQGIDLDIFVCAILPEHNAKGVDDLLVQKLKGKEDELAADLKNAILTKEGKGQFVQFYRIAERTDTQIAQLLNLEGGGKSLANAHKDKLKGLPKFRVGQTLWRFNDKGDLELAQPITEQEKFWRVVVKNDGPPNYVFRYVGLRNFLHARGFWKYPLNDKQYIFVKEDGKILNEVNSSYVRNFINEFIWEASLPEEVDELMMRGGDQYIGEKKLEGIKQKNYEFDKPRDLFQRMIFKNADGQFVAIEVTNEHIQETNLNVLPYYVWNNNIIETAVKYTGKPLLDVNYIDDAFTLSFTEEAFECDFIKYLFVTSSFSHNKIPNFKGKEVDGKWKATTLKEKWQLLQKNPEDVRELLQHLLNKISTFGFLLHQFRDANVLKAVVCMDGKESEVGASFGRSGKSIFGETFCYFMKVLKRNGKNKKLTENPHNFAKIDERTRLVFVDDCVVNFDFEYFFPFITGHVEVNPKGKEEIEIPREKTPKLIFTTNHAFVGHGDSFDDRQILLTFSDYFNKNYKPVQEFGGLLLDDWDLKQWNLFYNFCATALHIYFKFKRQFNGPIPGPVKKVELRKLRQEMSEYFVQWAEDFYDPDKVECKLDAEIPKKELYDDFKLNNKKYEQYNPINVFKDKLKKFCKYKGYEFNPGKPLRDEHNNKIQEWGGDNKKSGIEYIRISKPMADAEPAPAGTYDDDVSF